MAAPSQAGLDIPQLDGTVQFFCAQGIAQSTRQTYNSALKKFSEFCSMFNIVSPFPVSEAILCYFASHLATKNLAPQTIKTYLAGIRHMQIVLGLPEPRAFSSLPRLRLVQAGIQRTYTQKTPIKTRIRLPITPSVLDKIRRYWMPRAKDYDTIMAWAAAKVFFLGSSEREKSRYRPALHSTRQDI